MLRGLGQICCLQVGVYWRRSLSDLQVLIMKKLDHPNICRLFETYEQALNFGVVFKHLARQVSWSLHAAELPFLVAS